MSIHLPDLICKIFSWHLLGAVLDIGYHRHVHSYMSMLCWIYQFQAYIYTHIYIYLYIYKSRLLIEYCWTLQNRVKTQLGAIGFCNFVYGKVCLWLYQQQRFFLHPPRPNPGHHAALMRPNTIRLPWSGMGPGDFSWWKLFSSQRNDYRFDKVYMRNGNLASLFVR